MIGRSETGKTVGTGFNEKTAKAVQVPFPVIIVQKDIGAFNAPDDDVLQ